MVDDHERGLTAPNDNAAEHKDPMYHIYNAKDDEELILHSARTQERPTSAGSCQFFESGC